MWPLSCTASLQFIIICKIYYYYVLWMTFRMHHRPQLQSKLPTVVSGTTLETIAVNKRFKLIQWERIDFMSSSIGLGNFSWKHHETLECTFSASQLGVPVDRPHSWDRHLTLEITLLHHQKPCLLAPAHPGGPRKRAIKWLWCGGASPKV